MANSVGTVTLTAMADDENAADTVVGVTDNDDDDSAFMPPTPTSTCRSDADFTSDATLVAPADTAATFTTLTITVTPEDIGAANNKVYTVVIEREAPNSDATLKTLTVTHGDDEPVALKPDV